ncbi:hypothetical protein ZIOFF_021000 [Zingiber officinale]|uniref:Uncharacterized protein n=1 Tax=Zingiber officinale TaxID=94328 RepID=A0A8J5H6D7_ZINOF|nr:hypothetical protein ZIOFF_021000 [Zingiber officinale]
MMWRIVAQVHNRIGLPIPVEVSMCLSLTASFRFLQRENCCRYGLSIQPALFAEDPQFRPSYSGSESL